MKFPILLCLVAFGYTTEAASNNIYKIRAEDKAKPVITLIEKTYSDLEKQTLKACDRVEYQVEKIDKYVKTLQYWMGWTESSINKTLESQNAKLNKIKEDKPEVDFTPCVSIVKSMSDDVEMTKSNVSKCFQDRKESASHAEIEILIMGKKTLDQLIDLKNSTNKCTDILNEDVKKAFVCIASAQNKTQHFIEKNAKKLKSDIEKTLSKISPSLVDECLKDKPMRSIEKGLPDRVQKFEDCLDGLESSAGTTPSANAADANASAEATTVEVETMD